MTYRTRIGLAAHERSTRAAAFILEADEMAEGFPYDAAEWAFSMPQPARSVY